MEEQVYFPIKEKLLTKLAKINNQLRIIRIHRSLHKLYFPAHIDLRCCCRDVLNPVTILCVDINKFQNKNHYAYNYKIETSE